MAVTGQLDAAQLTVPWKVFDVALATTLVLTGFVAVALALGLMTRFTGLDRSTILTPWVLGALEGWMLAAVWAFGIRKYGVRWQALGFRRPNTSRRFLLPLVALTGSLVFTGIYAAIVTSVGIDYLRPPEFPADMLGQGFLRPLNALVIGLWVPFTEEVFFRGFLLAALVTLAGCHPSRVSQLGFICRRPL